MTPYNSNFKIGNRLIDIGSEPYFIADIAANHEGQLSRAKELIYLAKEAGADCAKFQHFQADKIVSDLGFSSLENSKMSHQASWKSSVSEIYDQYHTRKEWNQELVSCCNDAGIEFMTTFYDTDSVSDLMQHINAIKIGSGDISYFSFLDEIASLDKPLLLATGASTIQDVLLAVHRILKKNPNLCLMQCNTNYTADVENYRHINLNVLRSYAMAFPNMPLGLSDHTFGSATVVGSIALGARVIEKHFTDDNNREGPDHHFAMNPVTWKEMVERSNEVFLALGDGVKRVESNEEDTVVIQRRAIRLVRDMNTDEVIDQSDLEFLRPCPQDAISPQDFELVVGKTLRRQKRKGEHLSFDDVS